MRLIDADEFLLTTKVGYTLALMCTTNVAKKEILKATYEFIKERIGDTPTVDAVPVKHGNWADGDYCSICNISVYEGLDADIFSTYCPPFCPNCGAKMNGGEKNA